MPPHLLNPSASETVAPSSIFPSKPPPNPSPSHSNHPPVPNGGYIATIFLRAASLYLTPRDQPDPVSASWHFLNATHAGPAVLVVRDAKPGRGTSVLHMALYQGHLLDEKPWVSADSKARAVAYVTSTSLAREAGITLSTGFRLGDPPPPADLTKLRQDGDDGVWERLDIPIFVYVPVLKKLQYFVPKACRYRPARYDFWLRSADGEPFTNASLGWVCDQGPPLIVESFRPDGADSAVLAGEGFARDKVFWYPTVTMSLDVKKALPAGGEEWLRLRVSAKVVRNGRYDAEVVVFDEEEDVVALSNHVALAVDAERNWSRKGKL